MAWTHFGTNDDAPSGRRMERVQPGAQGGRTPRALRRAPQAEPSGRTTEATTPRTAAPKWTRFGEPDSAPSPARTMESTTDRTGRSPQTRHRVARTGDRLHRPSSSEAPPKKPRLRDRRPMQRVERDARLELLRPDLSTMLIPGRRGGLPLRPRAPMLTGPRTHLLAEGRTYQRLTNPLRPSTPFVAQVVPTEQGRG